ncbi:hypothetical protein SprV_0401474000 [Sparganum proliferum]
MDVTSKPRPYKSSSNLNQTVQIRPPNVLPSERLTFVRDILPPITDETIILDLRSTFRTPSSSSSSSSSSTPGSGVKTESRIPEAGEIAADWHGENPRLGLPSHSLVHNGH